MLCLYSYCLLYVLFYGLAARSSVFPCRCGCVRGARVSRPSPEGPDDGSVLDGSRTSKLPPPPSSHAIAPCRAVSWPRSGKRIRGRSARTLRKKRRRRSTSSEIRRPAGDPPAPRPAPRRLVLLRRLLTEPRLYTTVRYFLFE